MNLNHINLVVSDVSACVELFELYFGFHCTETKGNNIVAILKSKENFTLVIMASKEEAPQYPKAFHIGFLVKTEEEVMRIYNNLNNGGIAVGQQPGKIRGGFGFYLHFDSFMIEVGQDLS